jgi:hypothetical protein
MTTHPEMIASVRTSSSPIDVPPVSNVKNQNCLLRVVDLIDDTITADPDSPAFTANEFPTARRTRFLS